MGEGIQVEVKKKVWLEHKNMPLMGRGRYEILKCIDTTHSIKETAKHLHITEKTIQNYITKMENRLGKRITISYRGGRIGGGYSQLTPTGRQLLELFEKHDEK
ncbi:MAG: LysR family transcriptional regulator [Nanoarchaeota archaeon]